MDKLTGCPEADDCVLFGMPICAPYTAISNFKFKVKLVPGPMKRGKAGKSAQAMFIQQPDATAREKELIRLASDNQLSLQMLAKVKLVSGQLDKKATKGKKSKDGLNK